MNPKRKILYVITQGEWGGAQRYVFDLATNLGETFDVTVAVGEPSGRPDLQTRLAKYTNIKVRNLQHLVRAISPWHDWLAIGELAQLYRELEPDIVHLNSSKAGVVGSYAVRKLPKTSHSRIVYTAHGWVFDEPLAPWRQAMYRYLEKSTAQDKSAIIVLSRHDAERGVATGILKEKLHVVSHGIDPKQLTSGIPGTNFFELTPKTVQFFDKQIFVTIANLYPTKGIDLLIKAIAQARMELKNVLFYVFGEGPERKHLENLCAKYHLEKNIFLVGDIENAAWLLVHQTVSTFVLPSRKEGLPYVILEALQARVPIIATRVGGIPELIEDKKSGLLVNPDSVEELAQALCFAVANPDVMNGYAQNAPTLPSLSEMLAKTTSLYQALRPR